MTTLDKIKADIQKVLDKEQDFTSENAKAQALALFWVLELFDKYADQEPNTGHWIDKDEKSAVCSCCNRNNTLYGDFCKWCGAKMVEQQESEEE